MIGKLTDISDLLPQRRELPPREAYRLWAPNYDAETAVSALDDLAVSELNPAGPTRRLLDAGCGTGRRLPPWPGVLAVGVDLVPEMLATGRRRGDRGCLAAADVRELPFSSGTFDLIWCRLVLGHLPDLTEPYREFLRVACPGACLVVTDFHPIALDLGHSRTFRDRTGQLHRVETYAHSQTEHERAARQAGFLLERTQEWQVGPQVRRFYEAADALDRYQQQVGTPLLLALRFVK